jgi:flavin-dependent dehydrogenase
MLLDRSSSAVAQPSPVILGTGLTGVAISRALAAAGITHVLVGQRPTDAPRLGESLNAEGSLEIARQFPDRARFFFDKHRLALFFDGRAVAFDSLRIAAGRGWYPLFGYPSSVPLLHIDRVGFDNAAFAAAIGDDHCVFAEDRAVGLDYRPPADRIDSVQLASGARIASSYVFDATNHTRFVARKLGVARNVIGAPRRVVFAHYGRAENTGSVSPPWATTTALLRLDRRTDPIEGLAWCIPLGGYVSLGVSVDPEAVAANPSLLLDWLEQVYSIRGIDVRGAFPTRGAAVDLRYEHYTHARCYGRNWLLAGPSCCQIWFPSGAGVATGLIAARLGPDILRAPAEVPAVYQAYMDRVAASHSALDWTVQEDPWSVPLQELQRRSQAMIAGNATRLGRYLALHGAPAELAFGEAPSRLYQSDRLLANPLRIDTALPEAQATRLFAESGEPDPWTDAPIEVPVLTRPDKLDGPPAILGVVDMLAGRRKVDTSGELVAPDLTVQIDQFQLRGLSQWNAWITFLRNSPAASNLDLVPGSLSGDGNRWVLIGQWHAAKAGLSSVSPEFALIFTIADERVSAVQTQRADYTFITGDFIVPPVAFAALLGRLTASISQPGLKLV